ncbi:unnamed protein product [Aspergillus oryzae]|nr:unnamed protein product [Aspergillus oryzae]
MGTVDSAEDTVEVICRTDKCEAETVYLSRRQLCNSSSFLAAKAFLSSHYYTYGWDATPIDIVRLDVEVYTFSVRYSIPALANQALYQLESNLQQHWSEVATHVVSQVYDSKLRQCGALRRVLLKVAYGLGEDREDPSGGVRAGWPDFLVELLEERAYQSTMALTAGGPHLIPPVEWYYEEFSRRLGTQGVAHALPSLIRTVRHLLQASPEDGYACLALIWRILRPWELPQLDGDGCIALLLHASEGSDDAWESYVYQLVSLLRSQLPPAYQAGAYGGLMTEGLRPKS